MDMNEKAVEDAKNKTPAPNPVIVPAVPAGPSAILKAALAEIFKHPPEYMPQGLSPAEQEAYSKARDLAICLGRR